MIVNAQPILSCIQLLQLGYNGSSLNGRMARQLILLHIPVMPSAVLTRSRPEDGTSRIRRRIVEAVHRGRNGNTQAKDSPFLDRSNDFLREQGSMSAYPEE